MTQLTNKVERKVRKKIAKVFPYPMNNWVMDLPTRFLRKQVIDFARWNRNKLDAAKIKWYNDFSQMEWGANATDAPYNPKSRDVAGVLDDPPGTPPQSLHLDEEGFDYAAYQREADEKQEQLREEILERYRLVVSVPKS